MFSGVVSLQKRPKNKERFPMEGYVFECENKNEVPEFGEPLMGKFDQSKYAPSLTVGQKCIDILLQKGCVKIVTHEAKKFLKMYVEETELESA